ncbi:MAG: pilus assembly protein PilP [Desulfobacterales bacterium]|nr:pilus assembly protein PilP [Desulfobacterales bacterium]
MINEIKKKIFLCTIIGVLGLVILESRIGLCAEDKIYPISVSEKTFSDKTFLVAQKDEIGVNDLSDRYNPAGRIDPFATPIHQPPPDRPNKLPEREKCNPSGPLELVSLSQLKLTGVIAGPSGNKALVEQANGKGFIIGVNTRIGSQCGKVVEIKDDRIIVEEEDINEITGELTHVKRELKLQKPAGEL